MLDLELDFESHERIAVLNLFDKFEKSGDLTAYSINKHGTGKFSAEMTFKSVKSIWLVAKEWSLMQYVINEDIEKQNEREQRKAKRKRATRKGKARKTRTRKSKRTKRTRKQKTEQVTQG